MAHSVNDVEQKSGTWALVRNRSDLAQKNILNKLVAVGWQRVGNLWPEMDSSTATIS